MKDILQNVKDKYSEDFFPLQSRWFNKIFSSNGYICNIFPKEYDIKKYKNNYDIFMNVHKNIPEILQWNFDDNYFVQQKIQNIQDDWGNNENIELFFWDYLKNIFQHSDTNNIQNNISEQFIKKIYAIYSQEKNIENKKYLAELIKKIKNNSDIFQDNFENIIHWDLSDSNILFNWEHFYIIDFENISNFDIYYDLVSFDHFAWKNNSDIYKNIFWKNNREFSQKRYNINKDFFTFIHKNNLWNLI